MDSPFASVLTNCELRRRPAAADLFGRVSSASMARVRILIALVCLAFALGVAPGGAQETPSGDTPAVVVDDGAPIEADDAWTFRFLVPTVLALSGIALAVTVIGYRVRIRSRYRVVR